MPQEKLLWKIYWKNVIYAFGVIPALDVLFGTSDENLQEDEENKKKVNPIFDLMLYINLPIVFILLYFSLIK